MATTPKSTKTATQAGISAKTVTFKPPKTATKAQIEPTPVGGLKLWETQEDVRRAAWEYADRSVVIDTAKMPTLTGMCRYYASKHGNIFTARQLYADIKRLFPQSDLEIDDVLRDALVEGGADGKWKAPIVIFTLKNLYGWADVPKDKDAEKEEKKLTIKLVRDGKKLSRARAERDGETASDTSSEAEAEQGEEASE